MNERDAFPGYSPECYDEEDDPCCKPKRHGKKKNLFTVKRTGKLITPEFGAWRAREVVEEQQIIFRASDGLGKYTEGDIEE